MIMITKRKMKENNKIITHLKKQKKIEFKRGMNLQNQR